MALGPLGLFAPDKVPVLPVKPALAQVVQHKIATLVVNGTLARLAAN